MVSLTSSSGRPPNSSPVDVEITTLSPSRGLSSPKLQGFHMLNISDENIGAKVGNHRPVPQLELVQTMQGSVVGGGFPSHLSVIIPRSTLGYLP